VSRNLWNQQISLILCFYLSSAIIEQQVSYKCGIGLKADWLYFANIITKEVWLTVTSNYFNNSKHQTFVDLVILNPTITVTLMAKFNPTITAYLVPYITEGYDNKKFCYCVNLLLKVEHISNTMGTCALTDIYILALGPAAFRQVCLY